MKKFRRNSIIILIITLIVLIYVLRNDYEKILSALGSANMWFILLAVICYFIYFILDKLSFYNLTRQYKKDMPFKTIFSIGVMTKFFDGITPFSSGGQPYQVYELNKHGVKVANGTNIVIQNYIVFQIAFVLLGILAYILNHSLHLFKDVPSLKTFTIIGFTINGVILVLLMLIIFSKNFNKNIVRGIINLVSSFNKKMDKEKEIAKWDKKCNEYYLNGQVLLKAPLRFIKCIVYQTISMTFYFLVPLPLAYALGVGSSINIISTIAAGSYIYNMGCYVPIPGATGGMEVGFFGFFGNFYTDSAILSSLMILWRFITYYLPTLIGAIAFNIGPGKDAKKALEENKI